MYIDLEDFYLGHCSFETACARVVSAVDENQFNTGSISVPMKTFSNNGRIDHLWVINSLISQ